MVRRHGQDRAGRRKRRPCLRLRRQDVLRRRDEAIRAYVSVYSGTLPAAPTAPIAITTNYLNVITGGGNGVGIAYGSDGYLYASNNAGIFYKLDPSTGAIVATYYHPSVAVAGPSTWQVAHHRAHSLCSRMCKRRADADDQFTLSAHRGGTADSGLIGQPATTTGTANGVQAAQVGPLPILTGGDISYRIREVIQNSPQGSPITRPPIAVSTERTPRGLR